MSFHTLVWKSLVFNWVPGILIWHTLYQIFHQNIWHYIVRNLFCSKGLYGSNIKLQNQHSVESPSMVDPQWNIWYMYWGSKWNLHTVCWSAVGCEWGTTSVYFGITYVCFIPSRLPVFAVEPQYLLQHFLFLSKVSLELHTHTKSSKNFMLV